MTVHHRQETFRIRRIAFLYHDIQDQSAPAAGQVEFMSVLNVTRPFDD
jgi:hypothetical protein